MIKHNLLAFLITGIIFFSSCSTDDTPVQPENKNENYSEGIFIMNEGNYGEGNSTVSFLDPDTEEIAHQIFKNANPGATLGDTGQNMGFYKDYAFVVMNVSNTIEVVDRNTFKSVGTIETGLQSPRYITFSEGKAFVSNWGDGMNPEDDFISIFNAEDLSLVKTIPVAEGPEKVLSGSGKIFVAHAGGFNVNDKVSVIDAVKSEFETEITVGSAPNSLVMEGGSLWVLSGGDAYSEEQTAGVLSKIDLATNQVVQEISFSNATDHPSNLDLEGGQFFYTMGGKVYSFTVAVETLPGTPIFEMAEVDYLYGFEVENSVVYAASASPDFTGNGKLLMYDLTGDVLNSFETEINPNGIYFNE